VATPSLKNDAARWLTPTKALILLSDRYKSDDHFWFSFFHEAGHLLLHSKKETFVSKDEKKAKKETQSTQEEQEANAFAANQLIPRGYESSLPLLHTDADVEAFAHELGIAPGIVVGRLHNSGHWDWSKGNRLRESIDFDALLK
jgi:HTH-type transcriptional regulator/antitoxin HigA